MIPAAILVAIAWLVAPRKLRSESVVGFGLVAVCLTALLFAGQLG